MGEPRGKGAKAATHGDAVQAERSLTTFRESLPQLMAECGEARLKAGREIEPLKRETTDSIRLR